jgi:hypothetical protein
MQAYLLENEGVLALDADTFSNVEIIDDELALKLGRKSRETDGRIDILATYSQEYICIVEVKLGQLEDMHLKQLEDYLQQRELILDQYPDILNKDLVPTPKWIGVLVGSSIDSALAESITNGYRTASGIPIAALAIQRFRGKDGNIYVTTDTYFNRANSMRDTAKYLFDGEALGKGRLVLEVVRSYVETHPEIKFSALEKAFPKACQGSSGVFATIETASQIAQMDRKRHFLNPDELIKLADSTIAVSSQWGIGNIDKFIKQAGLNGYSIKRSAAN